ncbi:MAG: MMPL family transporter [Deltaproteobacteria bacterium]|nr:MMPL family transporter [Deltaproteobacteria bacterium]
MHALARWMASRRRAALVVLAVVALALVGGRYALAIQNEDDILAFLPRGNEDVKTFYEINDRFGGLDVGLVGIETADVFLPDFLTRLGQVSRALKDMGGLSHVLSLTTVSDFTADLERGGIVASPLVAEIPSTPEAMAALSAKVMSRDHVVGNLVSADGRAVLVYCFLAYGVDPRATTDRIRRIVSDGFPGERIRLGGNPFISGYVYETVQKDLRRLTPWAVGVIVLLMVLALRDVLGTVLCLLSNAMAIAITIGLMALCGVRLNLMLGSMPIVLFAIGCTYAIHMLFRYFEWRPHVGAAEAVARTLTGIGPAVLVAGLTAAGAILSYVVMDIQPIRHFGAFTALGIIITMAFALTFVPAALRLVDLGRRPSAGPGPLRQLMAGLAARCQAHRRPVGLAVAALAATSALLVTRIHTSVDNRSFFDAQSPPGRADQFLREHFGAAVFVQVLVRGDMNDPDVLREVQSLADRIELVPHVTSVQHVAQVIATLGEAMTGQRRVPDTADQVRNLGLFVRGDTSLGQLVTKDRDQALGGERARADRSSGAGRAARPPRSRPAGRPPGSGGQGPVAGRIRVAAGGVGAPGRGRAPPRSAGTDERVSRRRPDPGGRRSRGRRAGALPTLGRVCGRSAGRRAAGRSGAGARPGPGGPRAAARRRSRARRGRPGARDGRERRARRRPRHLARYPARRDLGPRAGSPGRGSVDCRPGPAAPRRARRR